MKQRETTQVINPLRRHMHKLGWHVEKTHGSRYMVGWPDLYCMHPDYEAKWIETKLPMGKLRASQKAKFTLWAKHGVKVWVITDVSMYKDLFKNPNWWRFV